MFYLLALLLCLAVMFIVAAGSSLVCALSLWSSKRFLHRLRPHSRANLLFMLRTLPWMMACLVTVGFALPAFVRFEPRSSQEMLGLRLFLLAGLGGLVIVGIGIRSLRMIHATDRAQRQWRTHSRPLQIKGVDVPVYCTTGASPLLAVTGLFRPKIFVAQSVVAQLSPGELFAAIAHEAAHVSALDNLKQLILRTTGLPVWLKLFTGSDAIWLNASEMAADERALTGGASALDLSSALVKVARLSRNIPAEIMIAASRLIPPHQQSRISIWGNPLGKRRIDWLRSHLSPPNHAQENKNGACREPQSGPRFASDSLDADTRPIHRLRDESAVNMQSSVEMRVNHLRKLLENEQPLSGTEREHGSWWPAGGFLALLLCYAACVNAVLPWMHEVLEMLVR